jgi:hypothetical protein
MANQADLPPGQSPPSIPERFSMRLIKLAAYALFGYVLYEFFVGLAHEPQAGAPLAPQSSRRVRSKLQAGSAAR